ncbi:MAG: siroheme synthase, partial [Sphingomonadaceae bacterium]|nr:siroheme synthase [Sphingomonadaceae bacterium]
TLATIGLRTLDPHDLTIGEAILLGRADRVFHEPGVPPAILDRARADADRIEAGAPPADQSEGLSIFIALPEE